MSGNTPQGGQGGQQPPQGGQQRGGQQQGQQPRGSQQQAGQPQRGQPPQGGPPPQQTGGGGGGGIDTDGITSVVLWSVAAFAIAGIAFGLSPVLFGFAGGDTTESVDANSTEADIQNERTQAANDIVSDALSDDNASAAAAYDRMQQQNSVIGTVIGIGPYFGFLIAILSALLVGLRSSTDEKTLAAGIAIATVVGLVLFVVLSTAIAGFQYNSMSQDDWKNEYNTDPADWNGPGGYPSSDVDASVQEELANEEVDNRPLRASDADISTIREIRGLQIDYGTTIVNSLLFGVIAALGAAGISVTSKRLSEQIQ